MLHLDRDIINKQGRDNLQTTEMLKEEKQAVQ
jgi:hypothetical protein